MRFRRCSRTPKIPLRMRTVVLPCRTSVRDSPSPGGQPRRRQQSKLPERNTQHPPRHSGKCATQRRTPPSGPACVYDSQPNSPTSRRESYKRMGARQPHRPIPGRTPPATPGAVGGPAATANARQFRRRKRVSNAAHPDRLVQRPPHTPWRCRCSCSQSEMARRTLRS